MDKQNFKMVLQSSNESKKKRKSCGADAELKKKQKQIIHSVSLPVNHLNSVNLNDTDS